MKASITQLTLGVGMSLLFLSCSDSGAGETAITIYSKATPGAVSPQLYRPDASGYVADGIPGYAIVRDEREITLAKGRSEYALRDVAALIDPTTVRFESLTDPAGTSVLEQDFRFDLVGTSKLLERYLDQKIAVHQRVGDSMQAHEGNLLSTQGGIVLQQEDGSIEVLSDWQRISFSELPGGLMTRPTLVWDVLAARAGKHTARVSYETAGITWWADYNLIWQAGRNPDVGTLSIGSWVSIVNRTGTGFSDATLKLVAGDVQRVRNDMPRQRGYQEDQVMAMTSRAEKGFSEKSFFEFHLYTLGRTTDLPNNSTKQIELMSIAPSVPAKKQLVYAGGGGWASEYRNADSQGVNVFLEFTNSKKNGLGVPLPAGRIRVSQRDTADDNLEFIGEDVIQHTPRNEDVRIRLGSAFDVLGERVLLDSSSDNKARWLIQTWEITLTNRKETATDVLIVEAVNSYPGWKISGESDAYSKENAQTIHFLVNVPADGKKTVRYQVRYDY